MSKTLHQFFENDHRQIDLFLKKALKQPGGIELGEKELSLLRTLRNQAVMAFKQVA